MTKKMKYQVEKRRYVIVEVQSIAEIQMIRSLNNEMDKSDKKEKVYRKHTISSDMLEEQYHFEFKDESFVPSLIIYIEFLREVMLLIISTLPARQKQVIIEHFYQDKSLRRIARENHLSLTSVRESYHAALKNLKKKFMRICK